MKYEVFFDIGSKYLMSKIVTAKNKMQASNKVQALFSDSIIINKVVEID
jgi:hypothetical protein